MFNNVGSEIKAWAKILVILITIVSVILGGVWGSVLFGDYGINIVLGAAIFGVIGYFLGRLSAMAIYAFGQLVESVDTINALLHGNTSIITPFWVCRTCGEKK